MRLRISRAINQETDMAKKPTSAKPAPKPTAKGGKKGK